MGAVIVPPRIERKLLDRVSNVVKQFPITAEHREKIVKLVHRTMVETWCEGYVQGQRERTAEVK